MMLKFRLSAASVLLLSAGLSIAADLPGQEGQLSSSALAESGIEVNIEGLVEHDNRRDITSAGIDVPFADVDSVSQEITVLNSLPVDLTELVNEIESEREIVGTRQFAQQDGWVTLSDGTLVLGSDIIDFFSVDSDYSEAMDEDVQHTEITKLPAENLFYDDASDAVEVAVEVAASDVTVDSVSVDISELYEQVEITASADEDSTFLVAGAPDAQEERTNSDSDWESLPDGTLVLRDVIQSVPE